MPRPRRFPAACGGAWKLRAAWYTAPRSSSSTSRPPDWIPVSRVAVWEMLTEIKNRRALTILITTHYMDEADRLCDRVAIVDHGKLVALDSPAALKASVPGTNVIEAQFLNAPADWEDELTKLEDVTSVQPEAANMYRILSSNGSKTTTELVELAVRSNVEVKSLSVQNTTLDDVFVHYTGRQLRDEQVKAYASSCLTVRGCAHEPDVGHRRTRAAQVLSLPGADAGGHGVSPGAVDRAGQCVRRQNQRRAARRGRPGPRHPGGEGPRSAGGGAVERAHLHAGALRQRQASDGGRAQRPSRRRHHHSSAIFAPRLRAEPSSHRAGCRQHRQLHELHARAATDFSHELRSISPMSIHRASCSRSRSIPSSCIPTSST